MRRALFPTRSTFAMLSACLAVGGLAACDSRQPEAAADPPVAIQPGAPPVDPAIRGPDEPADTNAGMRYRCEGGWNVAVTGDTAQVTADDGRVIELQRVADRSPPLFTGEALEFSVNGDGAVLGQDEGGPFRCQDAG